MKRAVRDIVWILLLAAIALTGIHSLSHKMHTARNIDEANPLALITGAPQAVLCLHQPQTLQLMLPSMPAVQRLLHAYLPESTRYPLEQMEEAPPITLVYYPQSELWMATLTEREAKQLWKRLDEGHHFAAEKQKELTLPVRYYPELGNRFLGCYYHQGLFVASYDRRLLRETIKQHLQLRPTDGIATELQAIVPATSATPLRLLLPSEKLFPASALHERKPTHAWLSLPFFFNEGNLCCSLAWPLPSHLPDSLLEKEWLLPLRDSLSLRLQPLLPGVETNLQATLEEQTAYFSLCVH